MVEIPKEALGGTYRTMSRILNIANQACDKTHIVNPLSVSGRSSAFLASSSSSSASDDGTMLKVDRMVATTI